MRARVRASVSPARRRRRAAQRDLRTVDREVRQHAARRARVRQPELVGELAEEVEPALDVPGEEQLLHRAATQQRTVEVAGARGLEVGVRGLGDAAGAGERVAEARAERPAVAARGRELEHAAIQRGGALVGEHVERAVGREPRVARGGRRVPGLRPVLGEHRGIAGARRLERARDRAVQCAALRGRQRGGHRDAHAVVVRLDRLALAGPARTHELRDAQHRDRVGGVGEAGGGRGRRDRHRRVREAHDRGQPARGLGLAREPAGEHVRERAIARRVGRRVGEVVRERQREQRVAARLARDRARVDARARAERRARERRGGLVVERADRDLVELDREAAQRRVARGAGDVVAHAAHEQQRRRLRAGEQVREQREAVVIRPLQVVDDDRERRRVRQPMDEEPHGRERARAHLARRAARRAGRAHRVAERREHLRDRGRVIGPELARGRGALDHARQPLDEAVDRLERRGLALVAATPQHAPGRELRVEEVRARAWSCRCRTRRAGSPRAPCRGARPRARRRARRARARARGTARAAAARRRRPRRARAAA